jgi:hypothetical protein
LYDAVRRAMLAHFAMRRGKHEAALEVLENAPSKNYAAPASQYLKAITEATLGKPKARASFAIGDTSLIGERIDWASRVYHEFLRDEAREAIEQHLGESK